MAISARKFEDTFPKGGYGIYFTINPTFGECENASNGYCIFLFADCDGNNQYDSSGPAFSCAVATPEDPYNPYPEKIEEISLETGIKILRFEPMGNVLTITFFPPDPEVTFNADPSSSIDHVSIILTIDGGQEKKVSIYKTGLIDID